MCAGNALRWEENEELRRGMNEVLDFLEDSQEIDGFLMPISKNDFAWREYPHYVRIWLTYGLLAAGMAGEKRAYKMLRLWQDWFNRCPDLPVIKYLELAFQGTVASPQVYLSPVGCEDDIKISRETYEEDWRLGQFLHNEPWQMLLFEYEARRYAAEGNMEQAAVFKSAVARSLAVTKAWLDKTPIRHIKNRFPTETKYGCEDYAYFDKYMITTASFLYAAYLICDDAIPVSDEAENPDAFMLSEHFHKVFMRAGGYFLEFDTNADPHYDSSGLGRVHKMGAPSTVCISVPCAASPVTVKDEDDVKISGRIEELEALINGK
jgi:hypothetical protein